MKARSIGGIILAALLLMVSGCGHEHTWADATCTEPKTCTECGETEGEPLGHTWSEATCEEPKTCSVCGETEGEPLGHTWDMATCQHPTTCKVCGYIPDETLADHTCDQWEEEKEATCAEEGYQKGICKYCGQEFTVVLEKQDHQFSEWETITEPTCSAEGEEKRTCSACGLEESKAIDKVDHDLADWEVDVLPVYGTDGQYIQKCNMCEEVINTKPYTFTEYISNRYKIKGNTEGFEITDADVYYSKDDYFIAVYGLIEVTNTGDKNLKIEKCSFEFNDDEGHLLGTLDDIFNTAGPDIIEPGQKGYVTADYLYDAQTNEFDVNNGVNVFVNIDVEPTNEKPVHLDISDTKWGGNAPDCVGRVTNNTENSVKEPEIMVLYRNEAGRVILVGHTVELDTVLEAGDSMSFEALGLWYDLEKTSEIADYEVIAYPASW